MNRYTIEGFTRISKKAARKLHAENEPVYMLPCNIRPGGYWMQAVAMAGYGQTFDQRVNEFEYYNCTNETGRYTAFYVK